MPGILHVNKAVVRQFLLERQGLLTTVRTKKAKPNDVLQTIRTLECVQIDPVAAVARNQHLVLAARLPGYQPSTLEALLRDGHLFEYWANAMCTIPMEDYPLFEPTRRRIRLKLQSELDSMQSVVGDVLKQLEREGPLPAKAFQSAERVHGYWENTSTQPKTKATSHVLNLLNDTGRIHVVRREGTTRFFDIQERAIPRDLLDRANEITDEEAYEALLFKYMRAYRVFDLGDFRFGWTRLTAEARRQAMNRLVDEEKVVPLQIEDVKRPYFTLAEDAEALKQLGESGTSVTPAANTVRFLPPLDNLMWRRERIEDLFGFSYTWEVYIPAAKRRFGYYAMPILMGDTIIGRIDPRLDRDRGKLDIPLLQIEPYVRWTKALRNRVFRGLETFARFHGAELGEVQRTDPEGLTLEG